MGERDVTSDNGVDLWPTEAQNPRTADLDRLPTRELLERILDEDARAVRAVRSCLPALVQAAEQLVDTLRAGGRWFNVGAGTSGRLGVLDAAELGPTFGLESGRVLALVAGGPVALQTAIEGAEDVSDGALAELETHGLGSHDTLVALSASGLTPYVLGAVAYARQRGAFTIAVTCSPQSPLAHDADLPIVPEVGPEVIAGSTRLKGGLAQKMILHELSTSVMVKLGRTRGNRMAWLQPQNAKLKRRATRILLDLGARSPEHAEQLLEAARGSLERALQDLERERLA